MISQTRIKYHRTGNISEPILLETEGFALTELGDEVLWNKLSTPETTRPRTRDALPDPFDRRAHAHAHQTHRTQNHHHTHSTSPETFGKTFPVRPRRHGKKFHPRRKVHRSAAACWPLTLGCRDATEECHQVGRARMINTSNYNILNVWMACKRAQWDCVQMTTESAPERCVRAAQAFIMLIKRTLTCVCVPCRVCVCSTRMDAQCVRSYILCDDTRVMMPCIRWARTDPQLNYTV